MVQSASHKSAACKFFMRPCVFVAGVTDMQAIPLLVLPEIAFVGRSNVGKSSMLNALTGQKSLARTSQTPGRTRQINFFALAESLMLVDLPGYGYAKASKREVEGWTRLMLDYLQGRPNLRRVCILIDSRHGLKESDREMMRMLDEYAVNYQIVLTKSDKAKKKELEAVVENIQRSAPSHPAMHPDIIVTSALKQSGIDSMQEALYSFVEEKGKHHG